MFLALLEVLMSRNSLNEEEKWEDKQKQLIDRELRRVTGVDIGGEEGHHKILYKVNPRLGSLALIYLTSTLGQPKQSYAPP